MGVVLVVVLLLSFLWGGCEEEFPYNEWEYQMDLATFKTTPEPMFVLDNGVELLPESRSAALSVLLEGDRCLLLYEYTGNDVAEQNRREIKINSYARTYCDSVCAISEQELSRMPDDPLVLTSICQEGDFVNIRLSLDVNRNFHTVGLFYMPEISNDTLKMELRHDKRGDSPGYLESGYFSYSIERQKENYRVLSVRLNSTNYGVRNFIFPLK